VTQAQSGLFRLMCADVPTCDLHTSDSMDTGHMRAARGLLARVWPASLANTFTRFHRESRSVITKEPESFGMRQIMTFWLCHVYGPSSELGNVS
jgi:hypothetical protein